MSFVLRRAFPDSLAELRDEVEKEARAAGLDFFPVIFEVVDWDEMDEVAAYGGFPVRYRHWRFGMEYEGLVKGYVYGLQKIYEMVINNDPCYAYLLRSNDAVDQKLVMAHVFAHCDFFKNNLWFTHTNRRMLDEMGNHATRVNNFMERHGEEKVEAWIDTCLSLEDLIDPHSVTIRRRASAPPPLSEEEEIPTVRRLPGKSYLEPYLNPPEFLAAEENKIRAELEKQRLAEQQQIILPTEGERDILLFLIEHAPKLEPWQREALAIIREEAYYLAPQKQTKIMNEGWASYWHSKILTERILRDAELIDYADHHAGTMGRRPGRINPYKLGLELFRDIERRWDRGQHGREWEECEDRKRREQWDTHETGRGREKIFEVRRFCNDIGFIDAFLTEDFCREQQLFTYAYSPQRERYEIASRDFASVKRQLLFLLTNFGLPLVAITEANYGNRGELYLTHRHTGIPLRLDWALATLANLQRVWSRPVHLETVINDKPVIFSYDGAKHTQEGKK